jgi:cytochrome c biogenesis protein CcdA/thiol-disulfide isomerase/thioredoxin
MLLLLAFSFVAGAGTGLTPCVLPVLPALLAASSTGGRRRPLAIVAGLTATMTLTVVGAASIIEGIGLGDQFLRNLAIAVLALFGVSLIVPALAHALERPLAPLSRFGPRTRGSGIWSGLGVGAALGVVCAPCAGPILGAVISVGATQGTSPRLVAVALAFGIGLGCTLLAIALGGRRLVGRIRAAGRGLVLQRGLGVVMLLTAFALSQQLDIRLTTALANDFPSFLTAPTDGLENSGAIKAQLDKERGDAKFDSSKPTPRQRAAGNAVAIPGVKTPPLPVLGRAPDFVGTQKWFNTPDGRPLSLASLRGHVVLVDFWTYTCINCIRTFPFLKALDAKYRKDGLVIVGVHTPEFSFEHNADNVRVSIEQNGLKYPVAQDNDYATWNAYGNQYWPADYLIDAEGNVRHTHYDEGDYPESEAAVRSLLAQADAGRKLGAPANARGQAPGTQLATPETYLGTKRAQGFVPTPPRNGTHHYGAVPSPGLNKFSYGGTWSINGERATARRGATLTANVQAQKVFLVLGSAGRDARRVRVLLDGRPIRASEAGSDVRGGSVTVRRQRLYSLVSVPRATASRLTLQFDQGISAFAFTFG